MAIKIKKKDDSKVDPELEEVEGEELDEEQLRAALSAENVDPFERRTLETANWIEKNRVIVLGGVVLVIAGFIGGYFYTQQQEKTFADASSKLDGAFVEYARPVEGSMELEQLRSNPQLPKPEKTYKTAAERWQVVYDSANATLTAHPTAPIAKSARLTKAGAALGLKKFDEAITLYEAYLADSPDEATRAPALQGLVSAYVGAKKNDKAIETLQTLEGLNEKYASSMKYQRAILLQGDGKVEDAKSLYHQILESDPTFSKKTDIERRLATL